MDDIKKQKLSWPKCIVLAISTALSSFCIAAITALILESDVYKPVREAKLLDKLLAKSLPSAKVTIPVLVFALLLASLFLNIILYKRMRIYYNAAEKFAKSFYAACLKLSKCLGRPVTLKSNNKDLTIDYRTTKAEEEKITQT